MPVKTVCAKHNITEATCYAWKRKYGGMQTRGQCSMSFILEVFDWNLKGAFYHAMARGTV